MDLLIQGVFGKTERAELASTGGRAKLRLIFKLWTIKEALIKAHGSGFAIDVSEFEVSPDMLNGATMSAVQLPQLPRVTWHVGDLGNERFAAAVAHELN